MRGTIILSIPFQHAVMVRIGTTITDNNHQARESAGQLAANKQLHTIYIQLCMLDTMLAQTQYSTCLTFFFFFRVKDNTRFQQWPQFQWPFSTKHMCYANLLIPHSVVLLEKPLRPQLINILPHRIQPNCSSPYTSQSTPLSLSSATWLQST